MRTLGLGLLLACCLKVSAFAAAGPIVSSEFIYETAPYPQSHASTIVETKAGVLAAAWFGGTHERAPDVGIWFSRNIGGKWQTPVELANGKQTSGPQLPTWNPVLFQAPGGDLFLYYKLGPSPDTWWGMQMQSADGGATWRKPRRLPAGILGPIKNKPVLLSDGSWLSPSSVEQDSGWTIHFERSTDNGRHWKAPPPVASPLHLDAIQPSILFAKDGGLEAVARTRQGVLAMTGPATTAIPGARCLP